MQRGMQWVLSCPIHPCPLPTPCPAQLWLEGMMLCGGGSSIPGLAARLLREMRGLAPQSIAPGIYGVPVRGPFASVRHTRCACRIDPCTGVSFPSWLLPTACLSFARRKRTLPFLAMKTHNRLLQAQCACCTLSCLAQDYMPEATLRHAAWMGGAVLARVSFSQVRACCV